MKLNNKGFAISSIMYIILVLAVVLIALTLAVLSSRKLILDKLRSEVTDVIYEQHSVTYREALNTLKEEIITYASSNNIEKDSVKISEFETSVDSNDLKGYKLSDKYLTVISNNNSYDVYIGEAETLNGSATLPENTIDISDYKIYGNSYQETSVQGKNLFSISNRTLGTLTSGSQNTYVREVEFDKYYVGLTMNNYYNPSKVISYSVSGENITVNAESAGYGIAVPIKVKPNTTYTLSAVTEGIIGIGFYTSSGEHINDSYNMTFTTPENCEIVTIVLRPNPDIDATYSNIQLEEGSKATQYEKFSPNMPSPDFPSEVLSVGDRTINLYEKKKENLSSNDAYIGLDMRDWEITSYTLQLKLKEGKTIPENTYFGFLYGDAAAFWLIENGVVNSKYPELITTITMSSLNGVACYPSSNIEAIWDAFDIFLVKGDYTTETIPPYEPYEKYKIPVSLVGKNLFDIDVINFAGASNTTGIRKDGNKMILGSNFENGAPVGLLSNLCPDLKVGDTFYIDFITNAIRADVNVNYVYLDKYKKTLKTKTKYVCTQEMLDSKVYFYSGITENAYIKDFIVTLEDDISYEPYVGSVTTNIYLDEPLRKINDYDDYIEFKNSKVYSKIKKIKLEEANEIYIWREQTGVSFHNILDNKYDRNSNALSNRNRYWTVKNSSGMWMGVNNLYLYWIGILDDFGFTTLEEFNDWLTNNSTYVLYASTTLTEEVVDLPRIQTLNGKVRLSIDTEIEPSKFEFTVIKKIKQL